MRSTFEFDAAGSSYDDLRSKVEEFIAKFLSIETEQVESRADIEMNARPENGAYAAKVYVRIK